MRFLFIFSYISTQHIGLLLQRQPHWGNKTKKASLLLRVYLHQTVLMPFKGLLRPKREKNGTKVLWKKNATWLWLMLGLARSLLSTRPGPIIIHRRYLHLLPWAARQLMQSSPRDSRAGGLAGGGGRATPALPSS